MPTFVLLPRHECFRPGAARLGLALMAGVLLSHCTSSSSSGTKSEVVVSVADQRMGLYEEGVLKKKYVISTSKFGLGDKPNSYCTPTGKHEIIAKIGQGLPAGAVLKSRSWNGEVLKPNAPGRDPIVSRILWLRGLESSNSNAMRRFIYIHGTTEENRLGQPASYGCIRMGMKDVVDVFNDLGIGAKVVITKDHLPGSKKPVPEKAAPAPEVVPAAPVPAPIVAPLPEQILAAKLPKAQPQTPEKAAAIAAAAAAPVPAGPIPVTNEQLSKPSFFSSMPWSRAKGKTASAPVPVPTTEPEIKTRVEAKPKETKPQVVATTTTSSGKKKMSLPVPVSKKAGKVGRQAPEALADSTNKKSREPKVISSNGTLYLQL